MGATIAGDAAGAGAYADPGLVRDRGRQTQGAAPLMFEDVVAAVEDVVRGTPAAPAATPGPASEPRGSMYQKLIESFERGLDGRVPGEPAAASAPDPGGARALLDGVVADLLASAQPPAFFRDIWAGLQFTADQIAQFWGEDRDRFAASDALTAGKNALEIAADAGRDAIAALVDEAIGGWYLAWLGPRPALLVERWATYRLAEINEVQGEINAIATIGSFELRAWAEEAYGKDAPTTAAVQELIGDRLEQRQV